MKTSITPTLLLSFCIFGSGLACAQTTQPQASPQHVNITSSQYATSALAAYTAAPTHEYRTYVSLSAKGWLAQDSIFREGGGIINEETRTNFYGGSVEVGRALSKNRRHWITGEIYFASGSYELTRPGKPGLDPDDSHFSDHLAADDYIGTGGFTLGYMYVRPLTSRLTLSLGAKIGFSVVSISDDHQEESYDDEGYYYPEEYLDQSSDSSTGVALGAQIGLRYDLTPRWHLNLAYGLEYQGATPDFTLSDGSRVETRGVMYHTVSIGMGYRF